MESYPACTKPVNRPEAAVVASYHPDIVDCSATNREARRECPN